MSICYNNPIHADQLLEAEDLLMATNDSSRWTNYSAATRILRRTRDIAAIPLLLRYMVLAYSREILKEQQGELRKLAAVVDSLQTQVKVAEQIESMRRSEYKRLLGLQGDEIVTAEESQQAYALVKTAVAEVKMLRSKLAERESK